MPALDRPKRTLKPASTRWPVDPNPPISTSTSKPTTTTSSRPGSWAPSKVFASTSPLAKPSADIHTFLVTCISGFDAYTEQEKRTVISSLPPAYRVFNVDEEGKLQCPITTEFVMSDIYLKRAVGKFKKDVSEGYWDSKWQEKARKAMKEREDGVYDDYLRSWVEETFGDSRNQNQSQQSGEKHEGEDSNVGEDMDVDDQSDSDYEASTRTVAKSWKVGKRVSA